MKLNWLRRGLMVLMLVLIGLRPTLPNGEDAETTSGNLDVLFVVDTTASMIAEDYNGGEMRLTGVKADIAAITERLAGARFGLIGFDNAAYQPVPFTTDATAVVGAADALMPFATYYANGTGIDSPVAYMKSTLESAAKKAGRMRVVFYMGDGEQTIEQSPASFSGLRDLIDAGAVLGYGTEAGGRFKETNYDGISDTYYSYYDENYDDREAVSRIDEENLRRAADEMGIDYRRRESPGNLDEVIGDVRQSVADVPSDRKIDVRQEIYWIFAVVFLGLLFWELWVILNELFPRKGGVK